MEGILGKWEKLVLFREIKRKEMKRKKERIKEGKKKEGKKGKWRGGGGGRPAGSGGLAVAAPPLGRTRVQLARGRRGWSWF